MMDFAHWTSLDFIISALIVLSLLFGLIRGFAKELISVIAWVVALFCAIHYSATVAGWFGFISNSSVRMAAAVIAIFVVVVLAGCLLSKLVRMALGLTGFGFFDRLLGLIFGAIRGGLFAVILLIVIPFTPAKDADTVKNSQLAPHFAPWVERFSAVLPKDMHELKNTSAALLEQLAVNA